MTTDVNALGARMRVVYLSLLAAAGCTAPGQPAVAEPTVDPAPKLAAKTEPEAKVEQPDPTPVTTPPPVTPTIDPGPVLGLPSCPSGKWEGTVKEAEARMAKGLGAETKLGCPAELRGPGGPSAPGVAGPPPGAYASLDEAATKALGEGQCSYTWVIPCPGGRPLVTDDALVRADVTEGTAWLADLAPTRPVPEALRTAIVAGWLLDARSEHASVASFARATLELMALAAPPALIAETQRASLDEVEHARLCFALASRCGGVALGPGPLPAVAPRPAELVHLACDTFVEGCVGETIAALTAMRAARGCRAPAASAALATIAEDETRHAELAWATLAWAVRTGGREVAEAVRALADELRAEALAEHEHAPDAADLSAWGRLGASARADARRDAWTGVLDETLALVLAAAPADDHAPRDIVVTRAPAIL